MSGAFYLATRYMRRHRGKTAVMIAAVTLTLLLPLAVTVLVRAYDRQLGERAAATPMVVGAAGNRYDLVLQALYFRAGRVGTVPASLADDAERDGMAIGIPLHARYTAQDAPVVGTDLAEYADFRGLTVAQGDWPRILGQAVLGHDAAQQLGLGPGDTLTTDQQNLYNLARNMPLRLRVVGVLAPTRSPDDRAAFVSLQTCWLIGGHGHGHAPDIHDDEALHRAARLAVEVTEDNVDSFHFHGELDALPLSAVIILPDSGKSRTILTARFNQGTPGVQALDPPTVMDELMGLVFRVKRFFDANFALVLLATGLLLGLVVTLSLKLRAAERRTLHLLGCGRWLIVQTQAIELGLVLGLSAALACGLAGGLALLAPRWLGM
jgi:putative ABC transport system permease protein